MREIIIIGSRIGFNGCQLLYLELQRRILAQSGIILIDHHFHELSNLPSRKFDDLESLSEKLSKGAFHIIKLHMDMPFENLTKNDHRKQKYIRQQHKFAQRYFRRK